MNTTTDRHGNTVPFSPFTFEGLSAVIADETASVVVAVARSRHYAHTGPMCETPRPVSDAALYVLDLRDARFQRVVGHLPSRVLG